MTEELDNLIELYEKGNLSPSGKDRLIEALMEDSKPSHKTDSEGGNK